MGDQERHPVPGPPARLEAPETRAGVPVPGCGLGSHLDSIVFCSMSQRPGDGPECHLRDAGARSHPQLHWTTT
eukprot:13964270-Alexandrium_andersonii.AAC.1